MTSKGKRPLRHLTASDKIEAIQRIHDGESKASVARDIGVPESTLRGWCKNEDKLRFMSRQSGPDKLGADQLADKIVDGAAAAAAAVSLLAGPPEKRAKLDTSGLPLNFSNKIKYDDLAYKRGSLNGLDFSTGKSLSDLSFNGLGTDYSSFGKADLTALNGSCKPKGYGADLSKQNDPSKSDLSMAAISPLTSLSHLSGMTSLAQSPLALSFNEIATNLNLIAQLNNPTLAAMTGLNGLNHSSSAMRNIKPKPPSHSPRNDGDKPQGLSVKNWAKCQQKSSNDSYGLNLSDCKSKLKSSPMSSAQPLGRDAPVDDALWYWLKSQQTMLGLNNLYTAMPSAPSPIRSSTPQQQQIPQHNHTIPTPPIASTPQTPSSTPSGSSDDTKNSSWFWQWYKTFGASLMSEKRSSTPQQHSLSMNNNHVNNNNNSIGSKPSQYENILYSQLTKDAMAGSDNLNNNNEIHNSNALNKPEDLSAKPVNRGAIKEEKEDIKHESDEANSHAKDVLDNLLYKNSVTNNNNDRVNNNNDISQNNNLSNSHNSHSVNVSMNSPNNDENSNHNNSHNDDIDVKSEFSDSGDISGPVEALEHGEKFLKWLESYSDPRVTAMQVMQFRYLLDGIRSSAKQNSQCANDRIRIRKRK